MEPDGIYITAAWLAQLVERQSAVREVEGSSPRPDQHSGENVLRRMCCLCNYISKWLDKVFSDKDFKP